MRWNDILVAVEAFFHTRQPGVVRPFHIRMAEAAIDLLHPRMDPMTEWNRLLRANVVLREKVVKVQQQHYEAGGNKKPLVPPSRIENRVSLFISH
jgi:hypothetical protein